MYSARSFAFCSFDIPAGFGSFGPASSSCGAAVSTGTSYKVYTSGTGGVKHKEASGGQGGDGECSVAAHLLRRRGLLLGKQRVQPAQRLL
jgi:hypothetical protein